jgi:sortase B
MKKTIWIMFAVILAAVITAIVGLSFIGKKEEKNYEELRSEAVETTKETDADKKETEDIKETSRHETKETEENETPVYEASMTIDHEKMKKVNSDYVCWINIPGTDISYPVVLPEDNDFYLHRTFEEKDYAYAGTLFIDAFSEKGLDQDNLIIYGHNMKNGTMFGELQKFKDNDYFEGHPYIEIHTPNELRVYQIFSVRDVSSDIDTLNFALSDFSKKEYIGKAINESIQSREVAESQIITLSTCVGDYSRRLLVSGVRIH